MISDNEICQDPLKEQGRTVDLNVAENKMFIHMVSDSVLQLAFKETLVKFWVIKEYPQLPEKTIKVSLFPAMYL